MGFWRDLFLLDEPTTSVEVGGSSLRPEVFHSTSLQGMRIASEFQNTGGVSAAQFRSSAVYRGATLLGDLTAQLPWYAVSGGDPSMTRSPMWSNPERLDSQPQLLMQPEVWEDRDDTIRKIVLSLLFHGNAYISGLMPVNGLPSNIVVADPNEVTVTWNAGKTRPMYTWRGTAPILNVNWWHLKLNPVPGAVVGTGPLQAGADIVEGIRNADAYARRLFTESGMPAGVLKVPGKLTKDEAEALKSAWDSQHAGGRGTAVLSGGIEFEGICLTPEQAQFLATRAYGSQEVSRLLGIPQWFLNAGSPPGTASALTYQNLNQVYVELARNSLMPTLIRRMEKVFSQMLPRGQAVKFDLSEFLRPDIMDRANAAGVLVRSGYEPNDVSRLLGLEVGHTGVMPITVKANEEAVSASPEKTP